MNAKHTAGELKYIGDPNGEYGLYPEGGKFIAKVDSKANAARLALCWNSHDELLDALQNLMNGIQAGHVTSDHDETFADACTRATAALKKATAA